jgi:hypothetical protein
VGASGSRLGIDLSMVCVGKMVRGCLDRALSSSLGTIKPFYHSYSSSSKLPRPPPDGNRNKLQSPIMQCWRLPSQVPYLAPHGHLSYGRSNAPVKVTPRIWSFVSRNPSVPYSTFSMWWLRWALWCTLRCRILR